MFDVGHLIQAGGILLIAMIVFAESGLLIGFFLPGDSLLFGAGLAASQGRFSLMALILAVIVAAIIGDNVGYSIGRRAGPRLFRRKDSLFFRQEYLEQAETFYKRHGGKTIVLARFTPIVRTFAPVVAGASKMPRKRFLFFNVVGGIVWGAGLPMLGYWVGGRIPHLDQYIEVVMVGVIVASFGLALYHLLKEKETRQRVVNKVRLIVRNIFLNKNID